MKFDIQTEDKNLLEFEFNDSKVETSVNKKKMLKRAITGNNLNAHKQNTIDVNNLQSPMMFEDNEVYGSPR